METISKETMAERVKRLLYLIVQAEKINRWRKRALQKLLTNACPRIAALGKASYMGCGFHYNLVQQVGNSIKGLAIPFQPSMNHLEKNWEDYCAWRVKMVMVEGLFADIRKAEKSILKKGIDIL